MVDKIAESLGVRPLEEALKEGETDLQDYAELVEYDPSEDENLPAEMDLSPANDLAEELSKDLETARSNVLSMIETGKAAFEDLVDLAKTSQNARSYEVAATLLEKVVAANREFVDLAEKKRMAKEEVAPSQQNITNNNLIISTSELLDQLLAKK